MARRGGPVRSMALAALAAALLGGCAQDDDRLALGAQCDLSSECAAPLVCRLERCRDECRTNRDCDIDSYCVFDTDGLGACVLPEETRCSLDSECPDPLLCKLSRCTNECREDRDCPAGHRCTDEACVDVSEEPCASDRDCTAPLVCAIDGRCREECLSSRDCRGGTLCESNVCVRPAPPGDAGMDGAAPDGGVDGGVGSDGGDDGGTGDSGADGGADAGGATDGSPPWIVLSMEPFFALDYRPFGAGSWEIAPRVPPGTSALPVALVHLVNAHDRSVAVTGVDLDVVGDAGALASVRLVHDVNANGRYDGGDALIDEVSGLGSSPVELRFSHSVGPLAEQWWLVELDVSASAAEGTTTLEIASAASVLSDADRFDIVGSALPLGLGGVSVVAPLAATATLAAGPAMPSATTVSGGADRVASLHLETDNPTGWALHPTLSSRGNSIDGVGTTAMISGTSGAVYRTEDGGDGWATQNVGVSTNLDDLSMVDAATAYAVGSLGNAFVTTSGGTSWSSIPYAGGNNLYAVHALSATEAWAVGSGGTVIHTTDGGTWMEVSAGAGSVSLWGVFFADASNGWIVGDSGTILHTPDGGSSWSPQTSGVAARLRDVFFADASEGWAVGDSGTILHTTNGGGTWTPQTACGAGSLFGVHLPDGTNGYALGASGTQCVTADGGTSWEPLTSPTTTVYGVRCPSSDASTCLAATLSGPARTTTGGVGETAFTAVRLHIGGTAPLSAIDAVGLWSSSAGGGVFGTTPLNEVRRPRSRDILLYWAPPEGRVSHAMATFDVAASASAGTVVLSIEATDDVASLVDALTISPPLTGSAQTIAP